VHRNPLLLQLIPEKFFTKASEFPSKFFHSISDTESNVKDPVQKTTSRVIILVLFCTTPPPPTAIFNFLYGNIRRLQTVFLCAQ